MFFSRRVEEDLEKIRRANLPPEKLKEEEEREQAIRDAMRSGDTRVTAKDVLAMTIAIFSLILPYFLIMGGVIALMLFWFLR